VLIQRFPLNLKPPDAVLDFTKGGEVGFTVGFKEGSPSSEESHFFRGWFGGF
jgi:hypothetical protein